MPIHEYQCEDCKTISEQMTLHSQTMSDVSICRHCGGRAVRIMSAPKIVQRHNLRIPKSGKRKKIK